MELGKMRSFLTRAAYFVVVAVILYICLRWLARLLVPFMLGFLIAYFLRPLAGFLVRHAKLKRKVASIVAAILLYLLVGVLLWTVGTYLFWQAQQAIAGFPAWYQANIEPVFESIIRRSMRFAGQVGDGGSGDDVFTAISSALYEGVASVSQNLLEGVGGWLKSLPVFLLTIAFTIISSVLICADYGTVTAFVMAQIPARWHRTVVDVRNFLLHTVLAYLRTYALLSLVTFGGLSLSFWALGIDRAIKAAALIALLDLLPVLGSGIVLIPWGAYKLFSQDTFAGIGMLVLWGIITFIRELLEPKILGKQIGLHPLVTLSAMYAGVILGGVAGLLLAPMLCLLLKYLQDNGIIKVYTPLEKHNNEAGTQIDPTPKQL